MAPDSASDALVPVTVTTNVSIPRPRTSAATGDKTETPGFPQGFRARRGVTVRVTKEQASFLEGKGYARLANKEESSKASDEDTSGPRLQRTAGTTNAGPTTTTGQQRPATGASQKGREAARGEGKDEK